jgi:hypothetical protein
MRCEFQQDWFSKDPRGRVNSSRIAPLSTAPMQTLHTLPVCTDILCAYEHKGGESQHRLGQNPQNPENPENLAARPLSLDSFLLPFSLVQYCIVHLSIHPSLCFCTCTSLYGRQPARHTAGSARSNRRRNSKFNIRHDSGLSTSFPRSIRQYATKVEKT